jgi:hypothetical protein
MLRCCLPRTCWLRSRRGLLARRGSSERGLEYGELVICSIENTPSCRTGVWDCGGGTRCVWHRRSRKRVSCGYWRSWSCAETASQSLVASWHLAIINQLVRLRSRFKVVTVLVGRGVVFVPGSVLVVPLSQSSCLGRAHVMMIARGRYFCTYHQRVRILKPLLRCWRAVP